MEFTVLPVFMHCVKAIRDSKFIHRANRQDKEFHFQDWFRTRLEESGLQFETGGRNSFPDFRMVRFTEGYEVKGLAYPGRQANYDSNSQVPSGNHNGRSIYYVFGRYPAVPDEDTYPVLDLVVCHGDFLNIDHEYVHKNKSVRGFGSYGDILIRDRKMYVARTPFGLIAGVAHTQTLILPEEIQVSSDFHSVGTMVRVETATLLTRYTFNLKDNTLSSEVTPNPNAGQEHVFHAWRLKGSATEPVNLREVVKISDENEENATEE